MNSPPKETDAQPPGGSPDSSNRNVDGIVLLDKPHGLSSNQALQRVKRLFKTRKAGHTGSLDPLATGMLPVCLGQATKVSAFLLDSDKVYRVQLALGRKTSTGDAEGEVIATGPDAVDELALRTALAMFCGTISQVPPMHSALKHRGRRLYELARQGVEVARRPRDIRIDELTIESFDPGGPVLRVRCSKGTYIRTLAEDIARAVGTVAHVAQLRRLAVEPFQEGAMHSLEELEAAAMETGPGGLSRFLVPADEALPGWPRLRLEALETARIRHGQSVAGPPGNAAGLIRLYGPDLHFLGVGERVADGRILPRRLMVEPPAVQASDAGL